MVSLNEAVDRFPETDRRAWKQLASVFPVRISRSWMRRLSHPSDPLGLQVFPSGRELLPDAEDVPDPVGEEQRMPVPWVVQKHPDRLLLLVTRRCHVHCRYCFRRDLEGAADPTDEELEAAIDFARTSGAREVILSGGDPLHVRPTKLAHIIDRLRPDIPMIRIHSRAPVTFPAAVTEELVGVLAARNPI
jgi:lysine 2,3-aminomutase